MSPEADIFMIPSLILPSENDTELIILLTKKSHAAMRENEENLKMRELEGPSETSRLLYTRRPSKLCDRVCCWRRHKGNLLSLQVSRPHWVEDEAEEAAEESQSPAHTQKLAVYSQLLRH